MLLSQAAGPTDGATISVLSAYLPQYSVLPHFLIFANLMVMNVYYNIALISIFLITGKPEHPFTLTDLGYLFYGLPVHIIRLFFVCVWLILIFALQFFLLMHRVVVLYTPSIFKVLAVYDRPRSAE